MLGSFITPINEQEIAEYVAIHCPSWKSSENYKTSRILTLQHIQETGENIGLLPLLKALKLRSEDFIHLKS